MFVKSGLDVKFEGQLRAYFLSLIPRRLCQTLFDVLWDASK